MRKIIIILVPALIALLGLNSCPGGDNDIADIVFPSENVSYMDHVQPVITYNCTYSSCHGVVCGPNAYPLYDYNTLVYTSYSGLVWPGRPDDSRLVEILEYETPVHYPYCKWTLTENQRVGIRKWISEGAKNN